MISGVSVICAAGTWFSPEPVVLRGLAAGAAVAAVVGAVVMRSWDRVAGRRVADLVRAKERQGWTHEERVAELEGDLEESREIRTKLERKLRAKRSELAGLRNEHAALLRRYATAETERASALEGRRLLAIEAAPVARAARVTAAGTTPQQPSRAAALGAPGSGGSVPGLASGALRPQAAPEVRRAAVVDRAAGPAAPVRTPLAPTPSLFLRANAALDSLTGQTGGASTGESAPDVTAAAGSGRAAQQPTVRSSPGQAGDGPRGLRQPQPQDRVPAQRQASVQSSAKAKGPGEDPDPDPARTSRSRIEPAQADRSRTGGARAASALPSGPRPAASTDGTAGQGKGASAQGRVAVRAQDRTGDESHERAQAPSRTARRPEMPTAATAVPPVSPVRPRPAGAFDFFGTKSAAIAPLPESSAVSAVSPFSVVSMASAVSSVSPLRPAPADKFPVEAAVTSSSPSPLEIVQNEDLADVVGHEALAVHKAEDESGFKPAGDAERGVGQVIDLTAHDETEQIDVSGLRNAVS